MHSASGVASVRPVASSLTMYQAALEAFDRFGRGRGHPAKLNIGDCMAYAVSKVHDAPLLFKGNDLSTPTSDPPYRDPQARHLPPDRREDRLALLVDQKGLKTGWLDALAADLAALAAGRRDLLVVSSGAIALGRRVLDLPAGPLKLEESQAAAAVGPDRACPRLFRDAAAPRLHRRPDPAHPRRHRGAPALPQRPLDHRHAPEARRHSGHQRERHGGHQRNPLRRQ